MLSDINCHSEEGKWLQYDKTHRGDKMRSLLFHSNQKSPKCDSQSRRIPTRSLILALVVIMVMPPVVSAKVVRIEIENRELVANGQLFWRSGAYERTMGKIYLEVDPDHPANQLIVDL